MVANLWQLRADVTALDVAAQTWAEMSAALTSAADQLVVTAQKAFNGGWDSVSAEGYDAHRKQVVGSLDSLSAVAENISDALVKVSGSLTAAQRRLDREWSFVALIPHAVVGPDQMIVFNPGSDEQNTQIKMAEANAATIRSDLDHTLYGDADTLRRAKTEFECTSRQWAEVVSRGPEAINVVGWVATENYVPSATTTVAGETQSGSGSVTAGAAGAAGGVSAGSLAPVNVSFTAPTLGGAGLAGAALIAAGRSSRKGPVQSTAGTGAMGGGAPMAGAAAGRGGGAMLAGKAGAGGSRTGLRGAQSAKATPSDPDSAEVREAREAKQKALAERKAAREARKAAREARKADREGEGDGDERPTANIVDD